MAQLTPFSTQIEGKVRKGENEKISSKQENIIKGQRKIKKEGKNCKKSCKSRLRKRKSVV